MADPQAMAQLASLGPAELDEVRQQLAQELNTFHQNALTLGQTASKFAAAGQAVEALAEQAAGQAVLLPLTESLYVGGRLARVDSVLLEVGTGYYVEVRAGGAAAGEGGGAGGGGREGAGRGGRGLQGAPPGAAPAAPAFAGGGGSRSGGGPAAESPARSPPSPRPPRPQKDVAGGVEYCRRKVLLVQESTKALAQMIRARQAALQQVDALLEQKLAAAEAAAAKAKA